MPRGPLPPTEGTSAAGLGVLGILEFTLSKLPPQARVLLANQVQAWAERVRREALAQMQPRPSEDDIPSHGATYTTTGHERPY